MTNSETSSERDKTMAKNADATIKAAVMDMTAQEVADTWTVVENVLNDANATDDARTNALLAFGALREREAALEAAAQGDKVPANIAALVIARCTHKAAAEVFEQTRVVCVQQRDYHKAEYKAARADIEATTGGKVPSLARSLATFDGIADDADGAPFGLGIARRMGILTAKTTSDDDRRAARAYVREAMAL
jgi:hypothetical protein